MVSVRPCGVSREARTLIFNGTRGFLFKTAKLIHGAHFSLRGMFKSTMREDLY